MFEGVGASWSGEVVEGGEVRRLLASNQCRRRFGLRRRRTYFTSKVMFPLIRYSTILLSLTTPSKFLIQIDLI